jgi:hypothetical protein
MKHAYIILTVLVALCYAFVDPVSARFRMAMQLDSIIQNVMMVDSIGVAFQPPEDSLGGPVSIYLIDLAHRDRDVIPFPALAAGAIDPSFEVDWVVLYTDGNQDAWKLEACQAYYWVWKHVSPFWGAAGLCLALEGSMPYEIQPHWRGGWCKTN